MEWSESHTSYELSSLSKIIIYELLLNFNGSIERFQYLLYNIYTWSLKYINDWRDLINNDNEINNIFDNIKDLVINSRNKVYQTVNTEMLSLYWNIGKAIMEIQQGDERASYGDALYMFPIATTVSSQLSWSHYLEIIKIEEEQKRNFYIKETINSKWSVRELQRQRDSLLYERLILSADKNKILELSEKGAIIIMTNKFIKNALDYIIFHLQLKCNQKYRTSL